MKWYNNIRKRLKNREYWQKFRLAQVSLEELLLPFGDLKLDMHNWNQDLRAGDFLDSVVFTAIVKARQPQTCFEIGTGFGRSSSLMSTNTPESTVIWTLNWMYPENPDIGRIFKGQPEQEKIQQLGGDSRKFDFSGWHGKIDLVFIDGDHTFDYVRADTENAFQLLRRGGCILWHDVSPAFPDVAQALQSSSRGDEIYHISNTQYAFYEYLR